MKCARQALSSGWLSEGFPLQRRLRSVRDDHFHITFLAVSKCFFAIWCWPLYPCNDLGTLQMVCMISLPRLKAIDPSHLIDTRTFLSSLHLFSVLCRSQRSTIDASLSRPVRKTGLLCIQWRETVLCKWQTNRFKECCSTNRTVQFKNIN